MGREEVGSRTRKVSAFICCLTYVLAYLTIGVVFWYKPTDSAYNNGFIAHILSTLLIFVFSFVCGNTSLYDPAWFLLPIPLAAGWLLSSEVTTRGIIAFFAVLFWANRFNFQWPWQGFFVGLDHEDWRYVDMQNKLSNSVLYWTFSLFGFHLMSTMLVFGGLQPVVKIWTAGANDIPLGPIDALAFEIAFGSVFFAYIADK